MSYWIIHREQVSLDLQIEEVESIEEANKKMLGENLVDIDTVLTDMKFKFGYGDISPMWLEEFEEHMGEDLINQLSTNEYTDLFSDWMNSKRTGSDGELEY